MPSINIGSENVTSTLGSPVMRLQLCELDDMQFLIRENGVAGVSLYVVAELVPLLDNYVD
jgi:hypothetical protein